VSRVLLDGGWLQKGHRVSYVFMLSHCELGGKRAIRRSRSKLARCIGQSVGHVVFFGIAKCVLQLWLWARSISREVRGGAVDGTIHDLFSES
jgi:hypothetical protein